MPQSILGAAFSMRSLHTHHRPIIAPSRLFSRAPPNNGSLLAIGLTVSRRQFHDVIYMDSSQEPDFSWEPHFSREPRFSHEANVLNVLHEPQLMIDQSALSTYMNNCKKKSVEGKKKLSVGKDHQDGSEKSDFHAYDGIPAIFPMSESEYNARIHSSKMKEGQRIRDEMRERRILGRVLGSFLLILSVLSHPTGL